MTKIPNSTFTSNWFTHWLVGTITKSFSDIWLNFNYVKKLFKVSIISIKSSVAILIH